MPFLGWTFNDMISSTPIETSRRREKYAAEGVIAPSLVECHIRVEDLFRY